MKLLIKEVDNLLQLGAVEEIPRNEGEKILLLLFPNPEGKRGPKTHS